MNYGLSYMGSKSKIVKHILPLFPCADNFVDLFAGGGAVTHYAMTTNKYKHFIFNDINPLMPKAFEMALNGEFENEKRWISREEFFRLRDTDPYVAICFSFGNNLSTYMYNEEIEQIKEAYHYALFFGDYSLAKERIGIDLTPLDKCATIKEKYAMLKRIVKTTPPLSVETRLQSMERQGRICRIWNASMVLWNFKSLEARQRCILTPPPTLKSKMQREEAAAAISAHNATGSRKLPLSDVIEFYSTDYKAVPIPDNSVIYCDIPYANTGTYQRHKNTDFDYERFYDWAYSQTQPIFISEYWMPEDMFVCIAEIKRKETFSSSNNSKKVTERVFVPIHQQTKIPQQLKLF